MHWVLRSPAAVKPGDELVIQWYATDNVGIDHIGLYLYHGAGTSDAYKVDTTPYVPGGNADGRLASNAYELPNTGIYTWTVPTNLPLAADYRVKVVAWDDQLSDAHTDYLFTDYFTVAEDAARIVSFGAQPGSFFPGDSLTLTATVANEAGANYVQFIRDLDGDGQVGAGDSILGNANISGGTATWNVNTTGYAPGLHKFLARIRLNDGTWGNRVLRKVTVLAPSNQPPSISSLSIAPGSVVRGDNITLTAYGVDDDSGVDYVQFLWDFDKSGDVSGSDSVLGETGRVINSQALITISSGLLDYGDQQILAPVRDVDGMWSGWVSDTVEINPPTTSDPFIGSLDPSDTYLPHVITLTLTASDGITNDPLPTFSWIESDDSGSGGEGTASLGLESISVPPGFVVTDDLVVNLEPNESDTFTVELDTLTPGIHTGQLTFVHGDLDESPFHFEVRGQVNQAPVVLGWLIPVSSPSSVQVEGVETDASGNVYVVGGARGTVDFDPGAGVESYAANDSDIFVAKYTPTRDLVWVCTVGGDSNDYGHAITLDGAGNVYATGQYRETVDFDPGPGIYNLTTAPGNNGFEDTFVWKLDNSGNFVWARSVGGPRQDTPHAIAVDNGCVYVTGRFAATSDFDPGPGVVTLPSNSIDAFVLKWTTSGDFQWVHQITGESSQHANDVSLDAEGNVFVTGNFQQTANFDPAGQSVFLTSVDGQDVFVAKRASGGEASWARAMGDTSGEDSLAIVVDDSDRIYVVGWFEGDTDFNPGSGVTELTSAGYRDGFLVQLVQSSPNNPPEITPISDQSVDELELLSFILYADGTAIGSALASGSTTTVTTDGSHDLADDSHSITARQAEPGKLESADSSALAIHVDTQSPAMPTLP